MKIINDLVDEYWQFDEYGDGVIRKKLIKEIEKWVVTILSRVDNGLPKQHHNIPELCIEYTFQDEFYWMYWGNLPRVLCVREDVIALIAESCVLWLYDMDVDEMITLINRDADFLDENLPRLWDWPKE